MLNSSTVPSNVIPNELRFLRTYQTMFGIASSGRVFFGPLKEMVGAKMMVLLEAARHATPQQSKRHRL
jgi:hypothetical protein